ncbi:hypothetical protein E2C01_057519 [Portunus trituberculatus]|uniref:Uncharacterized protein n=1 Tax=Portunus trituberculatus TaxID=210409 RepID=A0A5B7GT37_PORTR|nr:hypothetical protein [Portunus trituberculatus]
MINKDTNSHYSFVQFPSTSDLSKASTETKPPVISDARPSRTAPAWRRAAPLAYGIKVYSITTTPTTSTCSLRTPLPPLPGSQLSSVLHSTPLPSTPLRSLSAAPPLPHAGSPSPHIS